MKSNSRSAKDILKGIGAVIVAPFFIIFLILFGVFVLLLCLLYSILTKLFGEEKLPRIFNFLLDDFDNTYYDYYQNKSGYVPNHLDFPSVDDYNNELDYREKLDTSDEFDGES